MIDQQLLRYSRQIMLRQIDIEGQQRLLDSRVLIIGMGGLGSPVAMYLAACGVGELIIVDDDRVDLSNLQRQIIHSSNDIGERKVDSAAATMQAINPEIKVTVINQRISGDILLREAQAADVVVDATDNLASRLEINRQCFAALTPLVSASAIRWEGQLSVFDPRQQDSPCYQCFYGNKGEVGQSCSENGVMGPVVGMLGSMQANETVKLLTGAGTSLIGRVLMLDALNMDWQTIRLKRDLNCPVCGQRSGTDAQVPDLTR
jgi:molybdopterin/thiamine biosynthesis adenylyltransferase